VSLREGIISCDEVGVRHSVHRLVENWILMRGRGGEVPEER
jgi:hypothetical protein